MARRNYLITNKEGRERHVSQGERDTLLSARTIKQVGARSYVEVFRSFVDLGQWHTGQILNPQQPAKRYLDQLEVIFEESNDREWQAEETPDGFKARLVEMGMPATGFEKAGAFA